MVATRSLARYARSFTELLPDELLTCVLGHCGIAQTAALAQTCRTLERLAKERVAAWDRMKIAERIPTTLPELTKVMIVGGADDGRTGRVAKLKVPGSSPSEPSEELIAAGIDSVAAIPRRFAVVKLDVRGNMPATSALYSYKQIKILNGEQFAFTRRACKGDKVAARVLGHCLFEGVGGLQKSVYEGAHWLGEAAELGDYYASRWLDYDGEIQIPRYGTMQQLEAWPYWAEVMDWSGSDSEDDYYG